MALLIVAVLMVGMAIATLLARRRSQTFALTDAARSFPTPSAASGATGQTYEDPPAHWPAERPPVGIGCWLPIALVVTQFVALVAIVLIGMNEAGYDVCDPAYAPPSSMDRWFQRGFAVVSLLPFVAIGVRKPRRAWWILVPVVLCGAAWALVLGSMPTWDATSVRESCGPVASNASGRSG